jgi:ubiquinone biosynthesis protein COQ9
VLLGVKMANDNAWLESAQLKEKELTKIFEHIDDEIALITASAKFNFTVRKTSEKNLKIVLAYIEDTKKIVQILKSRMSLLSETTS